MVMPVWYLYIHYDNTILYGSLLSSSSKCGPLILAVNVLLQIQSLMVSVTLRNYQEITNMGVCCNGKYSLNFYAFFTALICNFIHYIKYFFPTIFFLFWTCYCLLSFYLESHLQGHHFLMVHINKKIKFL